MLKEKNIGMIDFGDREIQIIPESEMVTEKIKEDIIEEAKREGLYTILKNQEIVECLQALPYDKIEATMENLQAVWNCALSSNLLIKSLRNPEIDLDAFGEALAEFAVSRFDENGDFQAVIPIRNKDFTIVFGNDECHPSNSSQEEVKGEESSSLLVFHEKIITTDTPEYEIKSSKVNSIYDNLALQLISRTRVGNMCEMDVNILKKDLCSFTDKHLEEFKSKENKSQK